MAQRTKDLHREHVRQGSHYLLSIESKIMEAEENSCEAFDPYQMPILMRRRLGTALVQGPCHLPLHSTNHALGKGLLELKILNVIDHVFA